MQFIGFPTPAQMHIASERIVEEVESSSLSFYTYILEVLHKFSGRNAVPRMINNVLTHEYMLFSCRNGHKEDITEINDVASQFRKAGFYVEIDDSSYARISNTVWFLFCWDPQVLTNEYAENSLRDPDKYQLYLTVMRYVKAEQSVSSMQLTSKGNLVIGDFATDKWVSISIVTESMYNEALCVCDLLWDIGYYVGIKENARRAGTWILFVSWDPEIEAARTQPTDNFEFTGKLPSEWN